MEGLSGDLQLKYQKIASEYSKLRAQASVLKKAVIDEQSRNGELRDLLREREQSLRKSAQEIDSLTFRNQQLTKRVTVLQEELDATEARAKRGKLKAVDNHQMPDSSSVLDEELHKKIQENVRLVTMVQDNESSHKLEMQTLQERIEVLEHELKKHLEVNNDAEEMFKAEIARLEKEKTFLTHGAGDRDTSLLQCTAELTDLRQEHLHLKTELGYRLQTASDIITRHLPFVDSSESHLNELNVPRHERKQQLYSMHLIVQAGNHVKDLSAALSDYHTYTEQRIHCLQGTLSPVNSKFSGYLKENARYLRGIELSYSELQAGLESSDKLLTLQTLPSLQNLSSKLTAYTNYLLKLLPYQQLSLEEESASSPHDVRLVASNTEVVFQLKVIANHFIKLNSYVQMLAIQSKRACQHPTSSQRRFLHELTEVLKALVNSMKDLSRAHTVKSSLQIELSIATERLTTTEECLVKSIDVMTAVTSKLSSVMSDSRVELWQSAGLPVGGNTHPAVAALKKRASHYLSSIETEEAPSVPYAEALRDRKQVRGSVANAEQLAEQLAGCRKKAVKLEQDKEHWHLEYQLLQLKYSKRVKELEDELRTISLSSSEPSASVDPVNTQQAVQLKAITNLIGRVDAPMALTAEMDARELQVKNYLTDRIDHLVASCQLEETKAITFQMESAILEKRLELSLASKLEDDCHLQEANERVTRLQEELQTTTHNYETQLTIMSEHLANMNDKLTVQRDEIDQLKYQLSNKSSRKGKQK